MAALLRIGRCGKTGARTERQVLALAVEPPIAEVCSHGDPGNAGHGYEGAPLGSRIRNCLTSSKCLRLRVTSISPFSIAVAAMSGIGSGYPGFAADATRALGDVTVDGQLSKGLQKLLYKR